MSINIWNQPAPRTHYFSLPNEIFSLNLCAGELAIYAYLLYLENRKTHECYPSYRNIGAAVGIHSKNTVKKYVDMLEEKRLISSCPTKILTAHGVRNGNLLYHIQPIELAIQHRDRMAAYRAEAELERAKAHYALLKQHRERTNAMNWRTRLERRDAG